MPIRHVPTVMGIGVTGAAVERLSKKPKRKAVKKAETWKPKRKTKKAAPRRKR